MAIPKYIPHYSIEEYQQWPGDWELWVGVPVSMSPSADATHQMLAGRLFRQLSEELDAAGCQNYLLFLDLDWHLNSETVLRPDLLIVCDYKPEKFVERSPIMVAEILSDSTRQRDLLYKREIYHQQGVKYYLIVDPKISALRLLVNEADGYRESESTTMTLHADCEVQLDPEKLFR